MHGTPELRLSPIALADIAPLSLGPIRIAPAERRVTGPVGEMALEPRAMQVLVLLAEAQAWVVTRDALFRRCWGAGWAGDDSLNHAVADVRRALRQVAGDSVWIETVPRTGYKLLVAPVPQAEAEPASPGPAAPAPGLSRRGLVGAGLAAAGAGVAGWRLLRTEEDPPAVRALIAQADNAMKGGLPDADRQGVGFAREAVRLAPASADAWGKLALALTMRAEHAAPDAAGPAVLEAQQAAARALAIDPGQADAAGAMAILPPYFGEWRAAEARMQTVLDVRPAHFPTLDAWWFLLSGVGRMRDGSARRVAAARIEPFHAGHQIRLLYAYHNLGRDDEGDRVADRALTLWPKNPGLWLARLLTYVLAGRINRARAHFEDAAGRPDLPPYIIDHCRHWLTALEMPGAAAADRVVREVIAQFDRGPSAAVLGVVHLVTIGRIDKAMELARAYLLEEGPLIAGVRWRPGQVSMNDQKRRKTHMLFLPACAPLRAHPAFDSLVERIGLERYWSEAGAVPDFRQSRVRASP